MGVWMLAIAAPLLVVGIAMVIRGSMELRSFIRDFAPASSPLRFQWELRRAFRVARQTCADTPENRRRIVRIYVLNWIGALMIATTGVAIISILERIAPVRG
jgi:hypothetical protein